MTSLLIERIFSKFSWTMRTIVSLVIGATLFTPTFVFPFDLQGNSGVMDRRDSRFCLSCHDGTLAENILSQDLRAGRGNSQGYFQGQTPANFCRDRGHPIGIDYRLAQLNNPRGLKYPSQLDPAVKLRDGFVDCATCHDHNSQIPGKLVMENTGSRLCFSCHDL